MATQEQVKAASDKVETSLKSGSKDEFSAAHQEVFNILLEERKNCSIANVKEFNAQFKDENNKVAWLSNMELVGVDEKDKDLRFKDKSGNYFDLDSSGNKKAILGADENGNNGREFNLDESGKITSYDVKKGDTVWSIAETICNERNKGTGKAPTPQEIQAESTKLQKANPELANPDKIAEGKTRIQVSIETSNEINDKRDKDSKSMTEKSVQEVELNYKLAKKALERFDDENRTIFDSGYDRMTMDDIDAALKRDDLTPEDKQGLEFLKKNYDQLASKDNSFYDEAIYHEGLDKWKAESLAKLKPVETEEQPAPKKTPTPTPNPTPNPTPTPTTTPTPTKTPTPTSTSYTD